VFPLQESWKTHPHSCRTNHQSITHARRSGLSTREVDTDEVILLTQGMEG